MKHVILEKAEVRPHSRVRLGKLEQVRGYLFPEKFGTTYTPDSRGVMGFIQDHIGVQGYTNIIMRAAKESTYIMEGAHSAYLDIANRGRGTLEKMARTDAASLKPFLLKLFDHVSDDVIAFRKDLRKARTPGAKDKRPRKRLEGSSWGYKRVGNKKVLGYLSANGKFRRIKSHDPMEGRNPDTGEKLGKDLRKSRTPGAKDKKPRKKKFEYVEYQPENLYEESRPLSHREQKSLIGRILKRSQ